MARGGVASQGSRRERITSGLARPIAIGTAVGATLIGTALIGTATVAQASPPPKNGKVTLCHATPPASAKNGWVQITVSTNAVTHAGHGQHADDIIPAFTYYVKRAAAQYPGKNLGTTFSGSTGAQILANGCRLPAAPSSEPVTEPVPEPVTEPVTEPVISSESAPAGTSAVPETTEPAPEPATEPAPSSADVEPSDAPASVDTAAPYSVVATAATRPAGGRGAAPAVAVHAGLAAGDTGDSGGSGSTAGMTAAVVGAAVAALAGLGGLAYWRRRRDALDGPVDGNSAAG